MHIRDNERASADAATPPLPPPRGPISASVLDVVTSATNEPVPIWLDDIDATEALRGDDFHLALYVLYELHYRSFQGVDDRREWDPRLLRIRGALEEHFERALRAATDGPFATDDVVGSVRDIVDNSSGPSLSAFMDRVGTIEDMREFAIHRSAYQLKEADPHTWVLPRLRGRAKAAMVAIQFDEYGLGEQAAMHSELFADTLQSLGLDSTYGAYVDQLPGSTLATVNLVTMFGLHRRLRGALVGHLAVFEMTSVTPMQRYSHALERIGIDSIARRFYDVHVAADEFHQEIALYQLVAGLIADEPQLGVDVVFGAKAVMLVEATFAQHLLDSWAAGLSSLLTTPLKARRAGAPPLARAMQQPVRATHATTTR